ncbi:MAG: SPFH domain-containing protein [Phycisphaeraceae bacterium]
MKNRFILLVGISVGLVLLSYMLFFQVQFNEHAIRATFGSADASKVMTEPGFRMRLPWPFQQVYRYPTRVQIIDTGLTQTQTRDGYAVLAQTYMLWRIVDPLKFFKSLKDETTARERLGNLLRGSMGKFGDVDFKELVNTNPQRLKFASVEAALLAGIQADPALEGYGIKVEHVGVRRLVLPEPVTPKVFDRMKSDRQRIAADEGSRGISTANARIAEAESIKKIILSFADKYAKEIETKGKSLAAEVYKEFARDEAFAIYLRQMETLEKILGKTGATYILDVNKVSEVSPFFLMKQEPGAGARPPLKPEAE